MLVRHGSDMDQRVMNLAPAYKALPRVADGARQLPTVRDCD